MDLLFLDGEDLRRKPLEERRLTLGGEAVRDPDKRGILGFWREPVPHACENDLQSIVSKQLDRAYRSGRSRDWLKKKCVSFDRFVIVGYQPGPGAVRTPRANIKDALDGERLRYAGAVGTGVAAALLELIDLIRAERCVFAGLKVAGAAWVSPDLRARIAYRGVTTTGELLNASF